MKRIILAAIMAGASVPAMAERMNLTPTMRATLFMAIVSEDFNCPDVKMAHTKGPDAYGDVFKVWCGPEDDDGVFADAFRVTLTPSNKLLVKPWE